MPYDVHWNSVVLGMHMDGTNGSTTFTDSSASAKTVTPYGNAQISTAQSKFGGASAYFDGTGDYLGVASSTDLELGASDFTIEFWVRIESSSGQSTIFAHRASDVASGPLAIFRPSGTTDLRLYLSTGTSSWNIFSDGVVANALSTGVWKHIAICRNGSTFTAFVDGVSSTIGSSSSTIGASSAAWSIGGDLNNNYFNGYIDDFRITKGVARYTENFTPPTAAFPDRLPLVSGVVSDSTNAFAQRLIRVHDRTNGTLLGQGESNGTTGEYSVSVATDQEVYIVAHDATVYDPYWDKVVLAMHMDDTILSDVKGHTVTLNGNVARSSTQSKFGGYSAAFDGSGDYLSTPASSDFDLGTGDFTVELFFYYTGTTNSYPILVSNNNGSWGAGAVAINCDSVSYADKISIGCYDHHATNRLLLSTSTVVYNTWHHVAICRSGTTWRLFYDGVLESTNTSSVAFNIGKLGLMVGGGNWDGANGHYAGYMDDIRITKGVARYTANFTVPTAAFLDSLNGGTENAVILDRVVPG